MKFIRAISKTSINKTMINNLDQFGFTLIYRADTIEIWGAK